jgi:hypothetical protein
MVEAKILHESFAERATPTPRSEPAPLSAEAEAELRRLALKWATLLKDAETFEQPIRAVMLFIRSFGPPVSGEEEVKEKRRKKVA